MQIWPGKPYPLGATFDGVGTNFSALLRGRRARRALPVRRARPARRASTCPKCTALCWHGYLPGVRARAALRLPGARAVGARAGAVVQPGQAAARSRTPRRSTAGGTGTRRCSPIASASRRARRNDLDSAPFVPKSVVINPFFDWGDDRPPNTPLAPDDHLRDARQGLHARRIRTFPRSCAARTPAWRIRSRSSTCSELGVTAVELLPVHQFVHDSTLVERGLRNYWGYNSIGYLAPHNEYAASGPARRAGAGVQADGEDAARRRASR